MSLPDSDSLLAMRSSHDPLQASSVLYGRGLRYQREVGKQTARGNGSVPRPVRFVIWYSGIVCSLERYLSWTTQTKDPYGHCC